MEERLLEVGKDRSVNQLVENINKLVDKNFNILSHNDDIEKWNSVPKLLMLDVDKQEKLLNFVEYVDTLLISLNDKAMYIISLSGLIEVGKLNIMDYDDGGLFTLADYYNHTNILDIKKTLPIIGNNKLLLAVRNKTLELDTRKKILLDIVNKLNSDKIDATNSKKVEKFITDIVTEIEAKDYYELVD